MAQLLMDSLNSLQATRYCQLAVAVVAVYDHALTFRREVDLVWSRYMGDTILICLKAFQFQAWGSCVVHWSLQGSLQLRIYAMYRRSNRLLLAMFAGFLVQLAATATLLAINLRSGGPTIPTSEPIPGLPWKMCAESRLGGSITAIYIPILSFEFMLFALALRAGITHMQNMRQIVGKWEANSLMKILVKHSIFYFLLPKALNPIISVVSACAIETALWLSLPSIYMEISEAFVMASVVIAGARMVINFREVGESHFHHEVDAFQEHF
ncbi:hypothetical protein SERLADRAFT_406402 [Serpula lacrymans var. lacrymans S7.9]|uniref:DUF6533 domain-containing protein n=1 Tax=Serpula lacrymans var. lacrymans (strain S7.9) TaxID=578457 RepID=F8NPT3_SERL9|nr:uncharacterized protein SERLADRAFT_406402 [Serpula lacrymans var. lacrymans S7.9]EGO27239.1 hypothetical protein SERLADRAFT_406402 [Serpula lacrymans var. lacrymans S7.9]